MKSARDYFSNQRDFVTDTFEDYGVDWWSKRKYDLDQGTKDMDSYLGSGNMTAEGNAQHRQTAQQNYDDLSKEMASYGEGSTRYKQLSSYRDYYQNALGAMRQDDLQRGAQDFSKYYNDGKYTADSNAQYRRTADQMVKELDEEMKGYSKNSDYYKMLETYRDYYAEGIRSLDRTDGAASISDYILADSWHSGEDYAAQKKIAEDNIAMLTAELAKIEGEESDEYQATKAYKEMYEELLGNLETRNVFDSSFKGPEDYTSWSKRNDYDYAAQLGSTLRQKEEQLAQINPEYANLSASEFSRLLRDAEQELEIAQSMMGPSDYDEAKKKYDGLVAAQQLINFIDQLRTDRSRLEAYQDNEILYKNYGGYDSKTDYQKVVDDLREQLKKTTEGTADYEKINAQIRAIAGANGDGTNADGLFDENTFLGRSIMDHFDVEAAEARLAEIEEELRPLQQSISEYEQGESFRDNQAFAANSTRYNDLLAEKRQLTQQMNSSAKLQKRTKISDSYGAIKAPQDLITAGEGLVIKPGDSYAYRGEKTGFGLMKNYDGLLAAAELDGQYGEEAQQIKDMLLAALGAEEAGIGIGYTAQDVLDAYEGQINELAGYADAKKISEMDSDFLRWNKQVFGVGLQSGLNQFATGTANFFKGVVGGEEDLTPNRIAAKAAFTREDLKRYGNEDLFGSNVSQLLFDTTQTTANMLPMIVASTLATAAVGPGGLALAGAETAGKIGAAVGAASMSVSSAGNSYQQAISEGWDKNDARTFALITGAAEGALQYAIGGITSLGGVSEEGLLRAAQGINNAAVRIATKTGIHIASESVEELAQNRIERYLNYTLFDKGTSDWYSWTDDDWYTVLVTALSTGLMEAPGTIKTDVQNTRLGKQLTGSQSAVTEKDVKDIQKRIESKQDLTKKQQWKTTIDAIGSAMKGDEALAYTLTALGSEADPDSEAYKLAEKMKSGKLAKTANNYGTLFSAILSENKDAEKTLAAVAGGGLKYNEAKRAQTQLDQATGDLDEANTNLAKLRESNPGATVLNRTATNLQKLGADPVAAVETSAVLNKIRNGQALSSREMAEITGNFNEAKAARRYLAEITGDVSFAVDADASVTEALVTNLISTNREQKKIQAEQLQASVVAAANEAAAGIETARAAAGATKIVASDVKDLQNAKAKVAAAEQKADVAKQRVAAIENASFNEMAEAGSGDQLLINQLAHEREVLRAQIEGLTGNRMPSKAQARKLADLRQQYAEVNEKLQAAAGTIISERTAEAEAEKAEAEKAKTEKKAETEKTGTIPPKGNAAESAGKSDADTAVVKVGDTEVTQTRAQYLAAHSEMSAEEANQKFDDMVALSGGREGTVNNEQTADQNEGRSDLGGRPDGGADQERGARPEQGSDAGGDRGRRKLSTFDGSREVDLKEEVDSDATVTHSDDLSALEETHRNIRAFTDELLQAGFKRVTYVTNGRMYNEVGDAVPGFYNNGELFLALDPVPGWAGPVATAEHEKTHLKLDLYRASFNEENGPDEGDAFVSAALQNILGKDRYVDAFRKYWKRYSPVYLKNNSPQVVAHMVNEEMLCDMMGGIDNFDAGLGEFQEDAQDILDVSGFDTATENIAAGMAPGPVPTEYIDPGAMPHNIPVDTLLNDTNVDTPSTQPVNPDNASKLAFYGLASALGFKVDETHPKSKVYYLNDEDARLGRNGFTQITVDMIKASPIGNMIRYAQDKGYITEDQAEQEYNLFASIGSISDQTHDFYQAMQFMGSTIFTALKMNSDPQYGTTYDFPSICTKTQAVIDDMSAQMVNLKRALSEDEILEIYQRQFTAGNPVPCPECYVFSRWVGIGGLLDNIYYYQETYGSMTPEEVAQIYEENADKVAKAAEAAGVNFGKQKSKMASELQKTYNDLKERREKAESVGKAVSKKALADEEALRRQMADIRSLSWIDNVYFGGKAHTAKNVNKNFRVPIEVLFDLNEGEAFARDYKEAWAFRTTQGAGYGKAITPYAEAILGEGIQITKGNGAIKLKADGKLDHIFLTETGPITDKSERGKTLTAATKKQLNQLFIGGQRFQSTSDARFDNAVDYLLAGLEMQTMHGGVQVYTKVPGAVHFFNLLGMCTNMSLMPKGSGLDENGVPVDTTTGGMNPETAMMLRLGNEYAGTITIGVNDAHIRAMFNQAFRDFIIPYHASGGKAALISEFRRIQEGKAKGEGEMPQSTDYTNTQTDKFVTDEILRNDLGYTEAEIEDVRKFRATRIYILTNGSKRVKNNTFYREMLDTSAEGLTESQINARKILQQLYLSMQEGGEWYGVALSKGLVEGQIFPNEFWDTSVSYDESGVNTQRYLDYCKALGVLHRFSGKGVKTGNVTNKDGTVTRRGYVYNVTGRDQRGNEVPLTDLAYKNGKDGEIEPFFWKTLTDRRMYGSQGQYLKQPRVDLTNLKAENVVTFAAPMGERRYNRKDALRVAAQPLQSSQSRNSIQSTEIELTRDPMEEAEEGATTTRYSLRQEPAPQKTQWGFKLMTVDENGLPHAMFIDAAAPYEYGVWYNADSPKLENLLNLEPGYAYLVDADDNADMATRKPIRKVGGSFRGLPSKAEVDQATTDGKRWMVVDKYADGSVNVQNVGINGSGGISTFALRPGIHAVDIPSMAHIGAKSEGSKKIDTRRPNQRWFLIEYPVDNDYNQEAYSHRTKDIREHLPENGWYSFQTNSGAEARQHWFITGGMKIVGAVSEADIRKFAKERGFEEDLPWKQGKAYSEDDAIDLDEYIRTATAQPTPSKAEMRQRIEAERKQTKPVIPAKNAPKKQAAKTEPVPKSQPRFSIQGQPATAEQAQSYYSQQDAEVNEWAPEFYSKMQRTIEDWTGNNGKPMGAKMGANQVLGWLKGKGVKAEEIKWSGIIPYLEGKKSVTKDELLAVMAENEIKIETKVLEGGNGFTAQYGNDSLHFDTLEEAYVAGRKLAEAKGFDYGMRKTGDYEHTFYNKDTGEVVFVVEGDPVGDTRWIDYTLPGGHNYREILFKQPGLNYTNPAMRAHWQEKGVLAHARAQDFRAAGLNKPVLLVEEIQSDLHNAGARVGFAEVSSADEKSRQEKLVNLRAQLEEQRREQEKALRRGADLGEAIFARSFSPDFIGDHRPFWASSEEAADAFISFVNSGADSLSDWICNRIPYPSYSSSEKTKRAVLNFVENELLTGEEKAEISGIKSTIDQFRDTLAKITALEGTEGAQVADVPFAGSSDTYHEYVMKHLLRLAAEGGYDRLAWTTAQQQSDRWSDEYAEGYKIEYDQNIPKFMNKYVKQWGSKVGTTTLDNGDEVWSVDITPEMRDSVLHEGQPLFSIQNTNTSRYAESQLDKDIFDLVSTKGPEALGAQVDEWLANHEATLEAAKIKAPAIPSKGFVPRGTSSERTTLDRMMQEQIKRYGKMKPSEKSNGFIIPKKRKGGESYRRFYQNVGSAENLPADAQDLTLRELMTSAESTYVPDSDAKLIKGAKDEISDLGYGSAMTVFKRDAKDLKMNTKGMLKTIALGEQLIIEAAHQGDAANMLETIASVAELGTTIGKSLQAYRLLKMSGPIGELWYVDKAVKRINNMDEDRIKKGTANKIVAKPELCQAVIDAKTAEERDEAMRILKQDLADQCPKTLYDRWNAWRYLSMLGNVRTHARNLIGNAVFVPLRYTKDLLAAGGEFLATKAGWMAEEDRRKAVRVSRELRDFALADADVMRKELQGNGKYNPAQEILGMRKLLPGFLDTLSRINSEGIEGSKLVLGLEGEDWAFLRPAYARALAMQLEHSPYSLDELQGDPEGQRALNEMRKVAIEEAQKATYRDFSAVASWLNRGKQLQGAGRIAAIGLEGVLPFTKTPVNILKRGIEYSPAGIAKGLYTILTGLKNGELDVAEAIDQLSAGLTGTAVAALGWLLARMGWLRGKKSDDDEENFDKLQGYQDYSIQIGNQSFTIDWAAPTALPLFVGAAVADLMEEDHEMSWGDAWNAIMLIAEPMTSLSMLDGLNKLLDSTSYASGSEKIATVATQAATSYLGQAFPTILGQVARTIDGTRRSTYIDKNSPVPAAMQRFVQTSVQNKTPGWENAKVPYIDAWGRQSEAGSMVLNGIENFFMPFYRSVKNTTDVDEAIQDLYRSTKADILPSTPQKYFSVNGERKDLTADEWVSYATDVGQTKYALLTQLIYDPRYLALTDDQKAKAIKDYIYKYATTAGKYHIDPTYDIHGAGKWIEEAEAAATDYERFERIWAQIEKGLED